MPRPVSPFVPLRVGAQRFEVLEPRALPVAGAFTSGVRVEMQLVNCETSNHFDITVWIDADGANEWECGRIWALARSLCREHFALNRYPPRFSAHRIGVQLHWPEKEKHA